MRRTAHLTCAFALLAALAGCSTGISGTPAVGSTGFGPTSAASTQSTASDHIPVVDIFASEALESGTDSTADATSSADITLASGVTLEELKKDMQGAQDIVDGYWAKHWSDFYTGTYEPPTVLGLYDGTVADETPTCDGTPLEAYNAYVLRPGGFRGVGRQPDGPRCRSDR